MTELNQIYKCEICGNITEVVHTGGGELVCCGQTMRLMEENTEDAAQEKHVPLIEKTEKSFIVNVGEVDHPMDDNHYIEWIEVLTSNGKLGRKFLNPGDKPTAEFNTTDQVVKVRAYCNLHGLWSSMPRLSKEG